MTSQYLAPEASPKYIFIASEVRSGSTYIAELISYSLNESFGYELWDLAKELLRELNDCSGPAEVRNAVSSLWLSPQGFRSSKVMCAELSVINRCARIDPGLADLVFGRNARWVIVRRKNRIKQAVSLAVARETGAYHCYEQKPVYEPTQVSVDDIEASLRAVMLSDEYLRTFSAVPAVCAELFYEDVLADPLSSIGEALNKIGLVAEPAKLKLAQVKLVPERAAEKTELEARFAIWFLENHHPTCDDESQLLDTDAGAIAGA